jgi:hypothetical protein
MLGAIGLSAVYDVPLHGRSHEVQVLLTALFWFPITGVVLHVGRTIVALTRAGADRTSTQGETAVSRVLGPSDVDLVVQLVATVALLWVLLGHPA